MKARRWKQACLFLLILTVCLPGIAMTSCKKKETPPAQSTEPVTTVPEDTVNQYYLERFGQIDMKDKEVWIYDLNTSPDIHINHYDSFDGDSLNVALCKRDLLFHDLYGVSFEYFQNTAGSAAVSNSVLSDLYVADIIYGRASGDRLMTLAQTNCLKDLRGMDALSFDKPWWGNFISDALTVNNRLYFTSGDVLPTFYQSIGCFYLNLDMGATYGIDKEELCKAVEQGNWTWEMLDELSKDAYINLGGDEALTADTDQFGFISYNVYNHTNMFAIGCGLRLCEENESGQWIVDFESPNVVETLEQLSHYTTKYSMGKNGVDSIIGETFKSGRAVFAEHFTEAAFNSLRDMEQDFLMLPVPKLKTEQDGYRCMMNSYVNCFVGALSNCMDETVTEAILESMAYAGYHDIRPIAYEEFLKVKLARDPSARRMVDIIFDTAYIDYGVIEKFGVSKGYPQGASTVLYNYLKEGKPLVSEFRMLKSLINASLNQALENFLK